MTAAMHGVGYGTVVTVEYLDANRGAISSLNVRVNDRGPWEKGASGQWIPHSTRVIDLSPAAFKRLTGNIYLGVVPVRVYIP